MKLQGCEPSRISLAEGITTEIEKKLRSRKKTSRNQTDSDRWMEIYKTLFPTSISPDPCKSFLYFMRFQGPDS